MTHPKKSLRNWSWTLCSAFFIQIAISSAISAEDVHLNAPEGFKVQLFADDELAHDVFSMTINNKGQVVVSGPGYIRTLIDENGDGKAERAIDYCEGPESGAQGLLFNGDSLFCTADGGLLRYRDKNGDGLADGKPQVFLQLKTGAEHNSHAMRKGPDGWWYLIAGNMTGITSQYATLKTSPIKNPEAGVILRFNPDLNGGEILCDGFRNAYDFDFGPNGEIYSFDSDGERDITLPWYLPTRLFQSIPKSHHGWMTASWKRSESFPQMPPVVGDFGRGSPTGVICYRHNQYPKEFQDCLFIQDWTYGRVIQVQLNRDGSAFKGVSKNFLTAKGQHGFAPTDIEVGADGSMYVSVGGRGTRGGIYKISYPSGNKTKTLAVTATKDEKLKFCLNAPQPLSSWSRTTWVPVVKTLTKENFEAASIDESLTVKERIRAIEILTEFFGGPSADTMDEISYDSSAILRARTAWAYGRHNTLNPSDDILEAYLVDEDPYVVRHAIEALYGTPKEKLTPFIDILTEVTNTKDRYVSDSIANLLKNLSRDDFRPVGEEGRKQGWDAALSIAKAYVKRNPGYNPYAVTIGLRLLQRDGNTKTKLQAIHLIQEGLGGIDPHDNKLPAAYDGYTAGMDMTKNERELDPLRIALSKAYPTKNEILNHELLRLIAMTSPFSGKLLTQILLEITEDSPPVEDIHRLLVVSRIPAERTSAQRKRIAAALVQIDEKILQRGLPLDSHWQDRFSEIYSQLVKADASLPGAVVANVNFGRPAHIPFMAEITEKDFEKAVVAFVKNVRDNEDDYNWSNDVIFVLSQSGDSEILEMIRNQKENFAVRSSVMMSLAENLDPVDRPLMVEGLNSPQLEVIEACVIALSQMPATTEANETIALVSSARRLNSNNYEFKYRDQIISILRRNTKQNFGFIGGEMGYTAQSEVMKQWTNWLEATYPKEVAATKSEGVDLAAFKNQLANTDWTEGDSNRGFAIFKNRTCLQCHGGKTALGPDLKGIAGRFSRDDLFTAIVNPHRDVSPRYQTTLIGTNNGKVYTGMIVYESVDGLLLRNALNQTFRIEADDVMFRKRLKSSLMPTGLLNKTTNRDLADLYAYLKSLGGIKTQTASSDETIQK